LKYSSLPLPTQFNILFFFISIIVAVVSLHDFYFEQQLSQQYLTLPAMITLGFLDMTESTPSFTEGEVAQIVETEYVPLACLPL
jgi:hypothetical protein